jgi:hypothetical protein
MSTKLLSALLFSAFLFVPAVAWADPPVNRCGEDIEEGVVTDITSPGHFNKDEHAEGTPGKNPDGEAANVAAHDINDERKAICPPPGQVP